jgi:pimeloyl-ACP methyl ester carboxylesterase
MSLIRFDGGGRFAMDAGEPTASGPQPARPLARLAKLASRGLQLLVLVLLGLLAVLYFLQDRMIFPGAATQGRPEAIVNPQPGSELIHLTTRSGEPVTALFGAALSADGSLHPNPKSRPALVYFYGNAMCLAFCEPEFQRFRRLGLNVLIPDYLGYGMSGGKVSEAGCRRTGEACLLWLVERGFTIDDRIVVGGWSLGGAVAIDLAARWPVAGLFAFSTFTSTRDMSHSIIPLALPGFLFAHKFESLAKLPRIACPILLGHGRRDTLVPFSMHGRLAAAVKAPLSTFVVEGAEHNDFYDLGGPQIDESLRRFIDQLPR